MKKQTRGRQKRMKDAMSGDKITPQKKKNRKNKQKKETLLIARIIEEKWLKLRQRGNNFQSIEVEDSVKSSEHASG